MCNFQCLIIISSFISALAMAIVAIYTCKQHKIHYDSELTGFVKRFKSLGGLFQLECTLVNSGGVPIVIKNISYNLEDSKKGESIYCDEVGKFYTKNQDKLNECKTPLFIRGGDTVIFILPFAHWDSNGHILILPNENERIDTIKIKFDYFVYKNSKELFLSYDKK